MQAYSDPSRESDPYALPDTEIFYMDADDFLNAEPNTWMHASLCGDHAGGGACDTFNTDAEAAESLAGWYWWSCFPGCLPDGEPSGPFATEAEALEDARDGYA